MSLTPADMLNVRDLFAINLINELKEGKYSERAVEASGSLQGMPKGFDDYAISYMGFNLLQLLFSVIRVFARYGKIPIVSFFHVGNLF